jgi:hypothetical protein
MEEMGNQLVVTKMKFAQSEAEREELTQRLTFLKRAFDS